MIIVFLGGYSMGGAIKHYKKEEYGICGLKLFSSLSLLVLLAGVIFKEIYVNLL
jgi:hypothetical protein